MPALGDDQAARDTPRTVFVALGGLASGRASLQAMFSSPAVQAIPACFIVALRPDTVLDELTSLGADIQGWSSLPTRIIASDTDLQPGLILLLRPNMIAVVDGDTLRLRPEGEGEDGVLDSLAISLAMEKQEAAILVALDGLGHEGTLGTASIKQNGGLTLIEQADRFQDLAGDIADQVLPAGKIAARIQAHAAFLQQTTGQADTDESRAILRRTLDRVAQTLKTRTGHDFHGYKQATFMRRVARRMQVLQIADPARYADSLRDRPDEVQTLFQDLLIGVTRFFRDRTEFDLLARDVIPGLFAGKGPDAQVRVWTLGCATGEEAYSMAILLREASAGLQAPPAIQIFATDIDGRALASARAGRFADTISRDITPERLARWFVREGNTYVVVKELRELCIFSAHNILRDPPFSRIDLISCRNLLIYLDAEVQSRVIPLFHFSLRGTGVLFLGPSESLSRHGGLFQPIDRRSRIFRRVDGLTIPLPNLPLPVRERAPLPKPATGRSPEPTATSLLSLAERAVRRHAPAYVIVNPEGEVLHFSGRMGRFLSPSQGAATLNLVTLVWRELRLELRDLLERATRSRKAEKTGRLGFVLETGPSAVTLMAEPLEQGGQGPPNLVVTFHDVPDALHAMAPSPEGVALRDQLIGQLESDLRAMAERLQTATEEQEATSEELVASNEEYQSVNEELQSANEELETSKEELQSVNEELQTVNGELANRVHELANANSDLRNVLESTQIAVMFLDNDLRVKSFTPAVTEVFHLLESDKGRSITHIGTRVSYPELADDVQKVLRTLISAEREVGDAAAGNRYLVRILPYRSVSNFIAGAVVVLLDITAISRAETGLRLSEERFRRMSHSVPVFLFIATPELGWDYVNPPFHDYTGVDADSILDKGWLQVVHPDDLEPIQAQWRAMTDPGAVFEREVRIRSAAGEWRWFLIRAVQQVDSDGKLAGWFGSAIDIHERRNGEARQRLLSSELQHRVKNILAVVRSVVTRTRDTTDGLDEFASHLTGRIGALARTHGVLSRSAEAGISLDELVHDEFSAHGGQDNRQISILGPPVPLSGKLAEALGLAVHELTTNSLKYGALATPSGEVKIVWQVHEAGPMDNRYRHLILEWQEFGVPITDLRPSRRGFGRELIEHGLPYDLGATTALEFRPGGVRCVIEVDLASNDRNGIYQSESVLN